MKRLIFTLVLGVLITAPTTGFAAYESKICKGLRGSTVCTESEVGPFMQGITIRCGNSGDCSLDDIMQVFINVGNWVVGIIGAIVLLMYVAGGFYWLASAGRKDWVEKGKKLMTTSTAGLLIVMFAYLGIITLRTALDHGTFLEDAENYVACAGETTKGAACALNSTCDKTTGFICTSQCEQSYGTHINTEASEGNSSTVTWYDCVDINTYPTTSSQGGIWRNGCTSNLCPGSNEVQCCQLEAYK